MRVGSRWYAGYGCTQNFAGYGIIMFKGAVIYKTFHAIQLHVFGDARLPRGEQVALCHRPRRPLPADVDSAVRGGAGIDRFGLS